MRIAHCHSPPPPPPVLLVALPILMNCYITQSAETIRSALLLKLYVLLINIMNYIT
jgi:hypothetical protein